MLNCYQPKLNSIYKFWCKPPKAYPVSNLTLKSVQQF